MRIGIVAFLGAIACAGIPAFAQKAGAVFDKAAASKTLTGKNDVKTICTSYADVTVRETQDGPTSDKAMLLRGAKAACDARTPAGAAMLDTEGLYLVGRKGDYLLFSGLDAHGAADFVAIDARSGKVVLRDGTVGSPEFASAKAEGGVVTLSYTRGINAPCSLLNSGARCWGSLVDDGKIPEALARPAPAASLCAAAYKKAKSPKDNPSVISFAVETTIDAAGKVATVAKGKVVCDAMP